MYDYFVSPNNICISGSRGSTCNGKKRKNDLKPFSNLNISLSGDSGGSSTIVQNGVHTLIGIVSFGSHSCEGGHPVALVRVTAYLDWIAANTGIRVN